MITLKGRHVSVGGRRLYWPSRPKSAKCIKGGYTFSFMRLPE
jgi:hypothetical protein